MNVMSLSGSTMPVICVSVVIPVYNEERVLPAMLARLKSLEQDSKLFNFEFLFVFIFIVRLVQSRQ